MSTGPGPRGFRLSRPRSRQRSEARAPGCRKLLTGAALAAAAIITAACWILLSGGESTGTEQAASDPPLRVAKVEISYAYDIFDPRRLVGVSENVFAGRVVSREGERAITTTIPDDPDRPFGLYRVEVRKTFKSGGPRPLESGQSILVAREKLPPPVSPRTRKRVVVGAACGRHEKDAPLTVGRVYVFSTYHEGALGAQALTAQPTGAVEVSGAGAREKLAAAYREAVRTQLDPLSGEAQPCP